MVPGSLRRRRLIVLNTRTEHDRFVTLLESFETPVIAGFEATGNYHRPLAFRLLKAGIALRLTSSVALPRTREACTTAGTRTIRRMHRSSCTC
jgi:transposase